MNQKDLARRIAAGLREDDTRKPVMFPKRTFHISDDDGNHKDFTVQGMGKALTYTVEDVENILDMCQRVIMDVLEHGDTITVRGFGTLGLKYFKPRSSLKIPGTDIEAGTEPVYLPKFVASRTLKACGKVYALSLRDGDVAAGMYADIADINDSDEIDENIDLEAGDE